MSSHTMAVLLNPPPPTPTPPLNSPSSFSNYRLWVLSGSQTGTASEVAQHIGRMASRRGASSTSSVNSLACQPTCEQLKAMDLVVFVVSTTGDGEVPDDMKPFWRFLLRKSLAHDALKGMQFGIFGLGDSSYPKFNAAARRLQARLLQLGAHTLIPCGLGDDQHELGYYAELDPWLAQFWQLVLERFPLPSGYIIDDQPTKTAPLYSVTAWRHLDDVSIIAKTDGEEDKKKDAYSSLFYEPPLDTYRAEEGPCLARLVRNERITAQDWEQDVRHVEFDLKEHALATGHPCDYEPGDVALIYPENVHGVQEMISLLRLDPHQLLRIERSKEGWTGDEKKSLFPSPCSVVDLFTKYLDIQGTPRRYFFERVSLFASDLEEREKLLEMSTAKGADLLHSYCTREKRSYVEILSEFKSVSIPLEYILELIPRLRPRAFSIASSNRLTPGKVELSIAVVNFQTPYKRKRTGVCTSWICTLNPPSSTTATTTTHSSSNAAIIVPMWIKRGLLRLPDDPNANLILIGPGTGVAPMRSMVLERFFMREEWRKKKAKQEEKNLETNATNATMETNETNEAKEKKDILLATTGAFSPPPLVLPPPPPHLFMGCRHQEKDFLYGRDLWKKVEEGHLCLYTAFSRDQEYKIYVQARLMENQAMIFDLLTNKGAYCFIAGSAKRMPSDVCDVIRDIISEQGEVTLKEADLFMKRLIRQNRLIIEAWS